MGNGREGEDGNCITMEMCYDSESLKLTGDCADRGLMKREEIRNNESCFREKMGPAGSIGKNTHLFSNALYQNNNLFSSMTICVQLMVGMMHG